LARKHLEDGDRERLRFRMDETLRELREAAEGLRRRCHPKAAMFLERNVGLMVTFEEMALEGVRIPYTTNRVERLMGEIARRCKGTWMHWSTNGLRNILTVLLVRYTNEALDEQFMNSYIGNEAFI